MKEWGNDMIRSGLSKCDSIMEHRLEDREVKGTDPSRWEVFVGLQRKRDENLT